MKVSFRECQAFAKKNDITLLEPYIDRALSAKTDHRPNFLKMIKDKTEDSHIINECRFILAIKLVEGRTFTFREWKVFLHKNSPKVTVMQRKS